MDSAMMIINGTQNQKLTSHYSQHSQQVGHQNSGSSNKNNTGQPSSRLSNTNNTSRANGPHHIPDPTSTGLARIMTPLGVGVGEHPKQTMEAVMDVIFQSRVPTVTAGGDTSLTREDADRVEVQLEAEVAQVRYSFIALTATTFAIEYLLLDVNQYSLECRMKQ
jgi:hypothetical protein